MRRARTAFIVHRISLTLLPFTVYLTIMPNRWLTLHALVPTIQVFGIIPMLGAIGYFRARVEDARARLLKDGCELYCLACWYPATTTSEPEFLCPECGATWRTETVRRYFTPPVRYMQVPKPLKHG